MFIVAAALIMSILMASLSPRGQFIVNLVIFFVFTLPLCIILWKLEAFSLIYYVVNTVAGAIFDLIGIFYKSSYGSL